MVQTFNAFRADMQKRELERRIKSCQSLIKFHVEKEKEYRNADNWHMIRYCKKRRKALQSDLAYYQGELQKLSA